MRPEAARRHIYRERRLYQPPLPRSFEELGNMLDEYPAVQPIYQGTKFAADGSVIYIFGSTVMINRLRDVDELYIDGTFRVCIAKNKRKSYNINKCYGIEYV